MTIFVPYFALLGSLIHPSQKGHSYVIRVRSVSRRQAEGSATQIVRKQKKTKQPAASAKIDKVSCGCWLLVVGCWLLIDCWLLLVARCFLFGCLFFVCLVCFPCSLFVWFVCLLASLLVVFCFVLFCCALFRFVVFCFVLFILVFIPRYPISSGTAVPWISCTSSRNRCAAAGVMPSFLGGQEVRCPWHDAIAVSSRFNLSTTNNSSLKIGRAWPGLKARKSHLGKLVGSWTNLFEKYDRQNGFIFPK